MLEIDNTTVHGLERALYVASYPMVIGRPQEDKYNQIITPKEDISRGERLGKAPIGSGHDNFLSGIIVQCDIKYSMYWLKEFQRYHFHQINSSQSTMHSLSKIRLSQSCNKYVTKEILELSQHYIDNYNQFKDRKEFSDDHKYELFMTAISNMPAGVELWMGITTNYLQLKTIYHQRKNHKLKEDWGYFCTWCESLPYFTEFCGNVKS